MLFFAGCNESEYDFSRQPSLSCYYLNVNNNSLVFPASKSSNTISIESYNTQWQLQSNIDWINFSEVAGNTNKDINVFAEENDSVDHNRIGIIYLKSDVDNWNYKTPISVCQMGQIPFIELSETTLSVQGSDFSRSVSVNSNCDWEVECNCEWVSIIKNENSISILGRNNETNMDRTAIITVKYSGNTSITKNIELHQSIAGITSTTKEINFDFNAGVKELSFNSEASWVCYTYNSWISVSSEDGKAGNNTITIEVSPNISELYRDGAVYIKNAGNQTICVPIRQNGIEFQVNKSDLFFSSIESSLAVSINTNASWEISNLPSWLNVTQSQGVGSATINVMSNENPQTVSRTGTFLITCPELKKYNSIKVTQSGKTFDIDETTLVFEDIASYQSISINTNGNWNAISNNNWISITPTSGSGASELIVKVEENTNENERTGSISITMANVKKDITIIQKGKYIKLSNSTMRVNSRGGKISVYINSNDLWGAKVSDNSSWIHISPETGKGNVDVVLTISDNPSINKRTTNVIFSTTHELQVCLEVTQEARYLYVDRQEVSFYAKGGSSDLINITTDSEYKIESTKSWLSINQFNNTFTITAQENNEAMARNGEIRIIQTDVIETCDPVIIKITQQCKGGSFDRTEFDEDENWN